VHSDVIPEATEDVIDFFPGIGVDVSKVTWAHAVNSQDLLASSIEDAAIMMLEADVSEGHLTGDTEGDIIPIMAHPPHHQSDISLNDWVRQVIKANQEAGIKKGAKLDFKDLAIVKQSLEILKQNRDELTFPLWLNADILSGPGGSRTPVDANTFLSLCKEYFPDATLSVGWTTGYEQGLTYTKEMADEMVAVLKENSITQSITYPIRAAYVASSLDVLVDLVAATNALPGRSDDCSITVWSSASDDVDVDGLVQLQERLGVEYVYFDLPEEQMPSFEKARSRSGGGSLLSDSVGMMATAGIGVATALAALYLYE